MGLKTVTARKSNRNLWHGLRQQRVALMLACSWFCALAVAEPSSSDANSQVADRAMLEFLIEFSELDDAEFALLTAFAEKDEQIEVHTEVHTEAHTNEQTEVAPGKQTSATHAQQDETHE